MTHDIVASPLLHWCKPLMRAKLKKGRIFPPLKFSLESASEKAQFGLAVADQ
jgi:hypothetical protein